MLYGGTSCVLRFLGTWLLLVTGGGPTADKPTVTFAPPPDPDAVSHEMTIRVPDCRAAYETLRSRGAEGGAEREGRAKRFFTVHPSGVEALRRAFDVLDRMRAGVPVLRPAAVRR